MIAISDKYPQYPGYKDSGIEWVGEIPNHWDLYKIRRKLKDGREGIRIGPFGSSLKLDEMVEEGFKVYGQENVIHNDFSIGQRFITKEKFQIMRTYEVFDGDVLISMMGTTGSCRVVPDNIERGIMDSHLIRIRPNHSFVLSQFLALLIQEAKYIEYQILINCRGAIMDGLNSQIVKDINIIVPTISEQKILLNFLDRETTKLDLFIMKQKQLIELLYEKSETLITQVVTKGLNLNVKITDADSEIITKIPAHWEVQRNKVYFNEIDERSETGDEELLSVSHITGVTPRSEKTVYMFMAETNEGYKKCKPDDLVINTMWAWMGALGISQHDGLVSPSYHVYRLKDNKSFNPKYLDYLFRTEAYKTEITRRSRGIWTSRLRLYPDEFFELKTIKPPLNEQNEIVDHINNQLHSIDNIIGKANESIEKLKEYRIALISAAVTGKIDVRGEV